MIYFCRKRQSGRSNVEMIGEEYKGIFIQNSFQESQIKEQEMRSLET